MADFLELIAKAWEMSHDEQWFWPVFGVVGVLVFSLCLLWASAFTKEKLIYLGIIGQREPSSALGDRNSLDTRRDLTDEERTEISLAMQRMSSAHGHSGPEWTR